jgi:hypothetical protein
VLDALGRDPAHVLHAAHQPIAHPLQLRQREQARATAGANRFAPDRRHVRQRDVRESLSEDRRALTLQPGDLPLQGVTRITLTGVARPATSDRDISDFWSVTVKITLYD